MPHLQMIPKSHSVHYLLEEDQMLGKLPSLQRQGYSYSSPPRLIMLEQKGHQGSTLKDRQQEIFPSVKWSEPIQRTQKSSGRHKSSSIKEEKSKVDMFFPLKPICHKRAINPNNCQRDMSDGVQKDRKRPEYHSLSTSKSKQINYQNKFEACSTETTKLFTRQHTSDDHQKLYENQKRLTKEIRIKEILLHEKLLMAEEKLKKVRLRTLSEEQLKRQDNGVHEKKAETWLYSNEKRNWNLERAQDMALKGQRDVYNKKFRDCLRSNLEMLKNCPEDTKLQQKEKSREGRAWRNEERQTQRTTNYNSQEGNWSRDEITKQKREMTKTEKDNQRRERAQNWKVTESDQRDWKMEILKDREQRQSEQTMAQINVETDDNDKKWKKLLSLKSNLDGKTKAPIEHDHINGIAVDHWSTLEKHQSRNNTVVQTINKILPPESLTEITPHTPPTNQKGKRLQQVELSPIKSLDAEVPLVPCSLCHRRFAENRLEKHSKVCEKMQLSIRKQFDTSKYRAKGTDLEEFMKVNGRSKTPERKKNNWLQKHEALIQIMRQTRVPLPGRFQPQPSAELHPDYKTCPHCGRRFAPGPAERHIPKCQNIKSRPRPLKHC